MINYFKNIIYYKDLLGNLTSNELKLKYKNSILGILWSYIYPLMMIVIYNFAFKIILRMTIDNFALFVFIGLIPWNFVQASISQSTSSIVNNQNLVKKIYFPRAIIPLSIINANFLTMIISHVILFGAMFFYNVEFTLSLIVLPILWIILYLVVAGISLILSSITVKYRDVSHIVDVIFMAWFYLTPVIYSLSMVPEPFNKIIQLNPITNLIELFRQVLLKGDFPDFSVLSTAFGYSLILFFVGLYVFHKREKNFGEEL
ncbi:ABC transporter permease [Paenibacillus wynnii]|uniref:ABC transporter permease n=1 Tax=Paenibacillus wynnii TaxID=268407 RepID=UPI00278D3D32|nr:ABC transporter permease [Paenibacillus wynnii]MDQ0192099.1 ABC-2 type transport system permease protein [Paenibacillus wynnii]